MSKVLNKSGQSEIAYLPDKQVVGLFRCNHDSICKNEGDPL